MRLSVRSYQKYGNPCQTDVIERNGAVKRIDFAGLAVRVVLIPVDTIRVVDEALLDGGSALHVVLHEERQVVALMHPGGVRRRTDEFLVTVRLLVIQRRQLLSGRKKKEVRILFEKGALG